MSDNSLSTAEANRLLTLPKEIESAGKEPVIMEFYKKGQKIYYKLVSVCEPKRKNFILSVYRSKKSLDKITFHHLHEDSVHCLFRIDLGGVHSNPQRWDPSIPEVFKKYAGVSLKESHVHFYFEGFEEEWALPLQETNFKEFSGSIDIESKLQDIIDKVREYINLTTRIIYNQGLSYGEDE